MGWYWIRYRLGSLSHALELGEEVSPQVQEINSILLFGYMGLGDAMMFQPTLTAILRKYPDAAIDLLVGPHSQSESILVRTLDSESRSFGEIKSVNFKSLGIVERNALNRALISKAYDMCIATYTTPVQYFTPAIASARFRVGHTIRAQEWYKPRPNFLFNIARPVRQDVDEREPGRYFRLAMALGIQSQGKLPVPHLSLTQSERSRASEFMKQHSLEGMQIIGVHLGVSKAMSWKKWPDEKYAQVLRNLDSEYAYFLFFGIPDESNEIETARQYVRERSMELTQLTDILEVAALIERCSMVIGNDSGVGHLSIALGIPTLRVFGMSDHYGCEPYTSEHLTLYKDLSCSPCMNLGLIKKGYNLTNCGHRNCLGLITVEEVVLSAKHLEHYKMVK